MLPPAVSQPCATAASPASVGTNANFPSSRAVPVTVSTVPLTVTPAALLHSSSVEAATSSSHLSAHLVLPIGGDGGVVLRCYHTALAWLLWLPHSCAPRLLANECTGQGLSETRGKGGQETAPVLFAFHSRGESALWVDPCSLNWRQWVLNSRFGEQAQTGKRNLTNPATAAAVYVLTSRWHLSSELPDGGKSTQ